MNIERTRKQKHALYPIIPRSQAIYGSLVETPEPYSRDYTTYFDNIRDLGTLYQRYSLMSIKKTNIFG
jgi:hypothetical protein